jgi:hypothetical protein
MVVGVVSRVRGSYTGFMLAKTSDCCPAELQGQQNQQKDCHPLFHCQDVTGIAFFSYCPESLRGKVKDPI